ncbi:TPA: hypothetical protein RXK72_000050 [Escherichia coli]|nr:hypothetical protein [Escherichia coli]
MNDTSSDDILLLKQRLAEQEALIHALQEKLSNRVSGKPKVWVVVWRQRCIHSPTDCFLRQCSIV